MLLEIKIWLIDFYSFLKIRLGRKLREQRAYGTQSRTDPVRYLSVLFWFMSCLTDIYTYMVGLFVSYAMRDKTVACDVLRKGAEKFSAPGYEAYAPCRYNSISVMYSPWNCKLSAVARRIFVLIWQLPFCRTFFT